MIQSEIAGGPSRREALVEAIVDELGPLPRGHRFTAFGAARLGVIETVAEVGRAHPGIDESLQAYFGMEGWNR